MTKYLAVPKMIDPCTPNVNQAAKNLEMPMAIMKTTSTFTDEKCSQAWPSNPSEFSQRTPAVLLKGQILGIRQPSWILDEGFTAFHSYIPIDSLWVHGERNAIICHQPPVLNLCIFRTLTQLSFLVNHLSRTLTHPKFLDFIINATNPPRALGTPERPGPGDSPGPAVPRWRRQRRVEHRFANEGPAAWSSTEMVVVSHWLEVLPT